MTVSLIFAEFNRSRPDVDHFQRYFPEADIRVFTENDVPCLPGEHPRHGWRMNDYWKAALLLQCKTDVAIAMDGDMRIVDERVKALPLLAKRFGLCLPANPRYIVAVDTAIGADSDGKLDESQGTGHAVNCSPIAFDPSNRAARSVLEAFCRIMGRNPVRGPLAWWRAFWETGFSPCLLPPQWCVCQEHVGIGNEIILHVGHERVRRHYASHRASR